MQPELGHVKGGISLERKKTKREVKTKVKKESYGNAWKSISTVFESFALQPVKMESRSSFRRRNSSHTGAYIQNVTRGDLEFKCSCFCFSCFGTSTLEMGWFFFCFFLFLFLVLRGLQHWEVSYFSHFTCFCSYEFFYRNCHNLVEVWWNKIIHTSGIDNVLFAFWCRSRAARRFKIKHKRPVFF